MIIKKKYMNTVLPQENSGGEKINGENASTSKNSSVTPSSVSITQNEKKKLSDEQNGQKQESVKQPDNKKESEEKSVTENTEQKKKTRPKKTDLDFSLDNIKFDQRTERREGTRRRGYRRTQDRNLVSRAQQDAASIKESAKAEGYSIGVENAKKDLEDIKNKLSDFYKLKDEVFEKVSGCIYAISIETAKKILNKEVQTDKEYMIPLIKAAIEEINPTENKIVLKVMPKDVEIVRGKLPEIFEGSGIEASISVAADKNIKEGGAIIETSNGIIDASVETQLSVISGILSGKKGE